MRSYLLELRKQNKLSKKEMAKKLHITEQYYQMIESGKRQKKMDITLIVNLANTFNISTEKIVSEEEKILSNNNTSISNIERRDYNNENDTTKIS